MADEEAAPSAPDGVTAAIGVGMAPVGELLGGARVERAFGAPVEAGPYVVIPAAEVLVIGGVGFGTGGGGGGLAGYGGGGGGTTSARPVAVIEVGPEGVRVRPVLDVTKLGLALVSALLALLVGGARLREALRG